MAQGCVQSEAALIGGETAEHPGLMPEEDYDLAGFAVGVCDRKDMITGETLKDGDVLIGMASSGVHSNGFSLVRKVFEKELTREGLETCYEELGGRTLGETLLAPTRIYVKALKSVKNGGVKVKACCHITGGGFYENVPRMLREGTRAVIKKDSYEVPAIFRLLAAKGDIAPEMMYNTFNMGIGMVLAVDPADGDKTMELIRASGETPYVIGSVEEGKRSDLMLRVGVMASGGGTNLQAILDAIDSGAVTNAGVEVVISNNPGAYALERARNRGIQAVCLSPKTFENREAFHEALLKKVDEYDLDLIVLAGFLVTIPAAMIRKYRNRIINIHPSLIPSFCGVGFYGLKVHEAALKRGVKLTGATVHFVDEGMDSGPIILQRAVEVLPGDTPERLQRRVMEEAEWQILPEAIDRIANDRL